VKVAVSQLPVAGDARINPTLGRVRRGAVLLVFVLAISVCGYRILGRTWSDAVYMVAITVSTIGYTEKSQLSAVEQWFTVAVILAGLSASAYTVGSFFQLLTQGEIERALGSRRMNQKIHSLSQHVIVCGFGRMGQFLSAELHRRGIPFVVIDSSPASIAEISALHYLGRLGDATDEAVLKDVGVDRAKHLVTALPSDANNVFITLTARNLNPKLYIIARGELPSTQKKLQQAGATRVILPAAIGGLRASAMITKPSTIELMELFAGESFLDIEIDEIQIKPNCPLIGQTVRAAETNWQRGILLVAIKRQDGELAFNPPDDHIFAADDIIIVMGKPADVQQFCSKNRL
jgi:voltage-gated potassium channel